ncbi:protein of unknown function [Methylocaldum szegediense]|uniref:Secreted protein n=1 Tax=Methylocaldum szegediense TaxID=73780 RepID=A0ABN8XB45_9GAMM|nr:protein of unknown function [Methylocaldum szegediense]
MSALSHIFSYLSFVLLGDSMDRCLSVTSRMIIYREGVMLCLKPGAFSRRSLVRPSKVHHHADSSS